jgi:hypothetical protein
MSRFDKKEEIIVKRKGYLRHKKFEQYALGQTFYGEHWTVTDMNTDEEFRVIESYERSLEIKKNDGVLVQFTVVRNYGMDPYDNQIPGIDYYDAVKILNIYDKLDTRNIKIKSIISKGKNV